MPTRNLNLTPVPRRLWRDRHHLRPLGQRQRDRTRGVKALEQREAEGQARIEWLRNTTEEAFAALDRSQGIELSSTRQIDDFVNGVWEQVQAELSKASFNRDLRI